MTVQKDIQEKFGKLKSLLDERQKALTARVKSLEEEKLVEIQNASRCGGEGASCAQFTVHYAHSNCVAAVNCGQPEENLWTTSTPPTRYFLTQKSMSCLTAQTRYASAILRTRTHKRLDRS